MLLEDAGVGHLKGHGEALVLGDMRVERRQPGRQPKGRDEGRCCEAQRKGSPTLETGERPGGKAECRY
jgi:hypothetical protein